MITIGNEYFLTEMKLLDCNTVEHRIFQNILRLSIEEIKVK
jgi:hypothetical protein